MSIFDHILKFADEAAASAALPAYGFQDEQGAWHWRGDCTMPNISIITAEAVWDNSDPQNPVLVSPEVTVSGWYIAIALDHVDAGLQGLPNNALRFVSDRDRGGTGPQCVVYLAPDIEPSILMGSRVSSVFAGSNYVFGI